MTCHRPSQRKGVGLCVRTAEGQGLSPPAGSVGAVWLTRYYTDGWGTYERHVDAEQHIVGKEPMQRIESKPINLRTRVKRLVRRTLCFSKTERIHDLVIGLFVNRYEFGRAI